jgi:hypothetical protein
MMKRWFGGMAIIGPVIEEIAGPISFGERAICLLLERSYYLHDV